MMRVEFSVRARQDLAEIADYIAETNPARAHSFVDELVAAGEARGSFPHSDRRRRDVPGNLFTFPYGRYLIVYRVEPEQVLIRRIIHGARDLARALRDEDDDGGGA